MIFKLLLLFIGVPLIELTLLLMLAEHTSWSTTLAIVIVTGIVGTALARSQGMRTMHRVRGELSSGRMPKDSLVDAGMILVAGALLLTPGLLTDVFGLSLLVPYCRRLYRRRLKAWFQRSFKVTSFSATHTETQASTQVIDSYVVNREEEDQ